jgi:heptosyltransferase II
VHWGAVVKQLETGAVKNILIRGVNWVGDAVMSIPAMMEIRKLFPDAHIALLVNPWVSPIYAEVEFIDEILQYDKRGIHKGWAGFGRLISDLRRHNFDLAILLQNAFEAAFIAWCARIPMRAGYARDGRCLLLTHPCKIDPAVRQVHQVYYYLGILSTLGLLAPRPWERSGCELPIGIGIRETDRDAALAMLRMSGINDTDIVVAINPGAFYGEAKRWFPERYAAVADALADRYGAKIIILGASSDLETARRVAAHMASQPAILAGQTTLGQLMGLLKQIDLLITNDSGTMHLAAALDVPQLAIFGSTSEVATGPQNQNAAVIKHPVECNPCFLRKCPTDLRCMKGVSVIEVVDAARKILDNPQIRGRK